MADIAAARAQRRGNLCIVAAAGKGARLRKGMNKAFVKVLDTPILALTLSQVIKTGLFDKIVVAVGEGEVKEAEGIIKKYVKLPDAIDLRVTEGGATRTHTVARALGPFKGQCGYIAVQDGARPFATKEIFERTFDAARKTGGAIAAVPVKDTIKVAEGGLVQATPPRSTLFAAQTPQIFRADLLEKVYGDWEKEPFEATDDASLFERAHLSVAIAEGSYENIKITTGEDLLLAERISRQEGGK